MELTYRQLETTLRGHFQISPDRAPTFTSRIKQLQRLNFPSGVNIGRGVKMTYTGEHLFKLLTAFELIGLGLPAQTVAALVERHWPEMSAAYALDILNKRDFRDREKPRIYIKISLQSMHDIQFARYGEPPASKVNVLDHGSLVRNLNYDDNNRDSYCYPVILVSDIVSRVDKIAAESAGIKGITYDEEANEWLPKGMVFFINFQCPYPDRSNIKMRAEIHRAYGNDPESLTPEGLDEANEFIKNGFGCEIPF